MQPDRGTPDRGKPEPGKPGATEPGRQAPGMQSRSGSPDSAAGAPGASQADSARRGASRAGGQGADGETLRRQASELGQHAREDAEAQLQQQSQRAAEQLDALADGARAAADRLGSTEHAQLSQTVGGLAQQLSSLADSMRHKSVDALLQDVGDIARRNPALFVAGAVALGFGLSRFARASAAHGRGAQRSDGAHVMPPQQTWPDRAPATRPGDGALGAGAASGAAYGTGNPLTTPSGEARDPFGETGTDHNRADAPGSRTLPRGPGGTQP